MFKDLMISNTLTTKRIIYGDEWQTSRFVRSILFLLGFVGFSVLDLVLSVASFLFRSGR